MLEDTSFMLEDTFYDRGILFMLEDSFYARGYFNFMIEDAYFFMLEDTLLFYTKFRCKFFYVGCCGG